MADGPPRHYVIGAGPCGLSIAGTLADAGHQVVVLDGAPAGGGTWVGTWDSGGLYTKHSPQVAWGAYTNARAVLAARGVAWDDYFTPKARTGWMRAALATMSVSDAFVVTGAYIGWWWAGGTTPWKCPSVATVSDTFEGRVGPDAFATLGHLCHFFDGVGSDRMLLHEFFLAADQVALTSAYQASEPSDRGFPAAWTKSVSDHENVEMRFGCTVTGLQVSAMGSMVIDVCTREGCDAPVTLRSQDSLVVATDPVATVALLGASNPTIRDNWGHWPDVRERILSGAYQPIAVQFHTHSHTSALPPAAELGLGSEWSVAAFLLPFPDVAGGSTIACAVLDLYTVSTATGKTALESDEREVAAEVGRQLDRKSVV